MSYEIHYTKLQPFPNTDLCEFFMSASRERCQIKSGSKSGKGEKTVNTYCMFDEERLDPHGVGKLRHVLTIWSQRKS